VFSPLLIEEERSKEARNRNALHAQGQYGTRNKSFPGYITGTSGEVVLLSQFMGKRKKKGPASPFGFKDRFAEGGRAGEIIRKNSLKPGRSKHLRKSLRKGERSGEGKSQTFPFLSANFWGAIQEGKNCSERLLPPPCCKKKLPEIPPEGEKSPNTEEKKKRHN